MKKNKDVSENYDVSDIKILGDIEAIRKRPTLYVHSLGSRGVRFLIFELVSNSVDEFLAGFGKNISVILNPDNSITVEDDGRGIPIKPFDKTGKSIAEIIFTKLFVGGKFGSTCYKTTRGTYGVALAVVNALSEKLEVEIKREGKIFIQKYKKGKPEGDPIIKEEKDKKTGTKITFLADKEIFKEIEPEYEIIASFLRELSYLVKGIKMKLIDLKNNKEEVFYSQGGIASYLDYLFNTRLPLFKKPIVISGVKDNIKIEVAIQYFDRYYDKNIISFVNTVRTFEGGPHLDAFREALTSVIQEYIIKYKILESSEEIPTQLDIEEGIGAIISIFLENPVFGGIQKTYLNNKEIKEPLKEFFEKEINSFLEKNPKIAALIIEKVMLARKVRTSVGKVENITRKGFESIPLPPDHIYYKPQKQEKENKDKK